VCSDHKRSRCDGDDADHRPSHVRARSHCGVGDWRCRATDAGDNSHRRMVRGARRTRHLLLCLTCIGNDAHAMHLPLAALPQIALATTHMPRTCFDRSLIPTDDTATSFRGLLCSQSYGYGAVLRMQTNLDVRPCDRHLTNLDVRPCDRHQVQR
jgi:hypothetical protein